MTPRSTVTIYMGTSRLLQSPLTKKQTLDLVQPRALFPDHRIPFMAACSEYQLGKTKIISFQAYFNKKQLFKFSPKIRLQASFSLQQLCNNTKFYCGQRSILEKPSPINRFTSCFKLNSWSQVKKFWFHAYSGARNKTKHKFRMLLCHSNLNRM